MTAAKRNPLKPPPDDPAILRMEQHSACQRVGHQYRLASDPYHKVTGERGFLHHMKEDTSISYAMLYCTQCGETKEIVQADRRFGLEQIKSL